MGNLPQHGGISSINYMSSALIKYSSMATLIVEDFSEFASSLRGMMTNMGCMEIDQVTDGEEAIQNCKQKKYDIILSDYNMGNKKDGQQLLEELHSFGLIKHSGVFLMTTAETTSEMVMGALEFQPDAYLTKPFNAKILKARLDKAILKKQALAPILRLIEQKKWQQAIEQCNLTIKEHSKYRMPCLKKKFFCLRQAGKNDQAFELVTDLINIRPIPWALLGVGEIFFDKKDYTKAIDIFTDVIKEFPMTLEAYDWLAKAQYLSGQLVEAQKTLITALERSPKVLERQRFLGQIASENQDIETMTNAYRQAIKVGENSAFSSPDEFIKLTKSLGLLLQGARNLNKDSIVEEAESTFNKLEERFKGNTGVQLRGAVAHADFSSINNSPEKVKNYLDSANSHYANLEDLIGSQESIEISESLKKLGENSLAENILQDAVEQYLEDADFIQQVEKLTNNKHLISNGRKAQQLNKKAIQFFASKEYIQAVDYFSKAFDIAPKNINIALNYCQALLRAFQASIQNKNYIIRAKEILDNIKKLSFKDPRYEKYTELCRITQLIVQRGYSNEKQ